ncbi:MAG: hypothetical protein M1838_003535 [Thelocarpon superellum]|nr:MAG: hypothetical protein M1838_003535 [Thelocarpon superellum]
MIDVSIRLRRAIHLDDLLLVARIIRIHPGSLHNPDLTDKGNSSLHLAARLGRAQIVEYLIQAGHEDDGISRNAEWDTPLMAACGEGDDGAVTWGVEKGEDGGTHGASNSISNKSHAVAVPATSREAVVRVLLSHYARCANWRNRLGVDALMLCARHGHASLAALLLSHAADANAHDLQGNTALHYASAYGQLKVLRILMLTGGARPDVRNWACWTPASYSATVQAEVYFKGLVGEWERERVTWERERERQRERGGSGGGGGGGMEPGPASGPAHGGVRLVREDEMEEESGGMNHFHFPNTNAGMGVNLGMGAGMGMMPPPPPPPPPFDADGTTLRTGSRSGSRQAEYGFDHDYMDIGGGGGPGGVEIERLEGRRSLENEREREREREWDRRAKSRDRNAAGSRGARLRAGSGE